MSSDIYEQIVDALCIYTLGWRTEAEHVAFLSARDTITNFGIARRGEKIECPHCHQQIVKEPTNEQP